VDRTSWAETAPALGNANRGRPTAAQREEEIPPSKIRYGQDSLRVRAPSSRFRARWVRVEQAVAGFATRNFGRPTYLYGMPRVAFEPCIPTRGPKVPAGPDWLREIKQDGYRLIVQREGKRVRLFINGIKRWNRSARPLQLLGR
jgi:hypothetical protein